MTSNRPFEPTPESIALFLRVLGGAAQGQRYTAMVHEQWHL